jgi:hypothetical protein
MNSIPGMDNVNKAFNRGGGDGSHTAATASNTTTTNADANKSTTGIGSQGHREQYADQYAPVCLTLTPHSLLLSPRPIADMKNSTDSLELPSISLSAVSRRALRVKIQIRLRVVKS